MDSLAPCCPRAKRKDISIPKSKASLTLNSDDTNPWLLRPISTAVSEPFFIVFLVLLALADDWFIFVSTLWGTGGQEVGRQKYDCLPRISRPGPQRFLETTVKWISDYCFSLPLIIIITAICVCVCVGGSPMMISRHCDSCFIDTTARGLSFNTRQQELLFPEANMEVYRV